MGEIAFLPSIEEAIIREVTKQLDTRNLYPVGFSGRER